MLNALETFCSVCGGPVIFPAGKDEVVCPYCGRPNARPVSEATETTLMKYANERRNLGEFDEAAMSYRKVLQKNIEEHEARWGLLLCKYGVMYVEDAATRQRLITCRRVRNASLRADPDFRRACADAPAAVRAAYERDAEYVDQVQAEIRRLRSTEPPWDAFICYKETDERGERTRDSVRAQNIYTRMKARGYRVFFAHESLKEKSGANYEAAIFAALADSRVMLVLGSSKAYFESTWVRSEWKRYLEMIDAGEDKLLVPMYEGLDPGADLPMEFRMRYLQALDMADLGALFDLEAILDKAIEPHEIEVDPNKLAMARVLLTMQGKFDEATMLLNGIIAQSRECAEAYFLRCMARAGVQKEEALAEANLPLRTDEDFGWAIHFGNRKQKQKWGALADRQEERLAEAERKRQALAEKLKNPRALVENGRFIDARRELHKFIKEEPECAEAHLLKCMAQLGINSEDRLPEAKVPLTEKESFGTALSLADDAQRERWQGYAHAQQARFEAEAEARIAQRLASARKHLIENNSQEAVRQIESVLKEAPERAEAHLLMCMAQLGIDRENRLPAANAPLMENERFKKALELADDAQRETWQGYAHAQQARFKAQAEARNAQRLASARERLGEKNFPEALRQIESVLVESPERAEAHLLMCMAQLGIDSEDRLPAAKASLMENERFKKALELADDAQREKWQGYVQAQQAQGNAQAETEKKLKHARALLENNRFYNALRELHRFLDAEPECAEAYLLMCMAQLGINSEDRLPEAKVPLMEKKSFGTALSLADDAQRARWQGYAHAQQARFEAEAEARIAQRLASARKHLIENNSQEAVRQIESVLKEAPERAEAHLLMCMAQLGIDRENRLPAANAPLMENERFKKALELADDAQRETWQGYAHAQQALNARRLARARERLGEQNFQSAMQLIVSVLETAPEHAEAHLLMCMAQLGIDRENRLPAANAPLMENERFKKALELADDAQRETWQGYVEAQQARFEAEAFAEKLKSARDRVETSRFYDAHRKLQDIIDAQPACAEAHLLMCMAQLKIYREDRLPAADAPLMENDSFKKALELADDAQRETWQGYAHAQQARFKAQAEARIAERLASAREQLREKNAQEAMRQIAPVLEEAPECAEAYLLVCMARLGIDTEDRLSGANTPLMENKSFKTALDLADDAQRAAWQGYANAQQARFKAEAEAKERKRALAEGLKSARALLENAGFDDARQELQKIIDAQPECAEAHLLMCMAQLQVSAESGLPEAETPLEEDGSFKKALELADDAQRETWQGYLLAQQARFKAQAEARIAQQLAGAREQLLEKNAQEAMRQIESVLDEAPECAEAHLLMCMARLGIDMENRLPDVKPPLMEDEHFKKALELADGAQRETWQAYANIQLERIRREEARKLEQQHMAEEALRIRICAIGLNPNARIRDSWEEVIRNIDHGAARGRYAVGDWKVLEIGTLGSVVVQLAGFELDERADGKGRAATTWIAAELMAEGHRMNDARVGAGLLHNRPPYTVGTGAIGGWQECELRRFLKDAVMPKMPTEIRRRAVRVVKRQKAANVNGELVDQATSDALWIPDHDEVFGKESRYFGLFNNKSQNRVRRKKGESNPKPWWLRSVWKNTAGYLGISEKGRGGLVYSSSSAIGVVIGFCL